MPKEKSYKRLLVTSALPYANGPLHLGHIAGAYLPADIYVRYQRLKKQDVIYICGSDEHGVPITVTADREGISPQDVVDRYHAMNKDAFERLNSSFDHYSRTSLPVHHETAQTFFSTMYEKDDFIVKEEKQFYSEATKRFLPDRYVEGRCPHCDYDKARGDQCDNCGKWLESHELLEPRSKIDGSTPILKSTQHWYLPMGRFSDRWKAWFDAHEWKDNVRNYCMGWYREGLGDRPITRDLPWGIPVPLEEAEGKVLYVWFDAPIGYISATKEWAERSGTPDRWKEYWCSEDTKLVHFIGKDNIVFHAILFPMMLMEAGDYVLPAAIPANEYLTIEGRKISTSQNYAIWLKDYLDAFPADSLRYTLACNAPETKDTDFSWNQFQSRNNDELADILGNFVNRTLTFVHRYYDGTVPERGKLESRDEEMLRRIEESGKIIGASFEGFEIRAASKQFMDLCRAANKYFNDSAPWESRKSDPSRCATTLNICVEITHALSILMAPILPTASQTLRRMLNLEKDPLWEDIRADALPVWFQLGTTDILFQKVEDDLIQAEVDKLRSLAGESEEEESMEKISFDTFKEVELRTARVLEAERVDGTDKLLKLQVDLGSEKRQIIAGVAESYSPEAITGKTIIVVANLNPVTIRGVESNGMLLAVSTVNGYSLVVPDGEASPGVRVE